MIMYIKQSDKIKLIYRIFKIFRKENKEGKIIIYLPINKKSRKRRVEKVVEKLCKYFYNNCIKNVVLEENLMENNNVKNVLYSNNINILDGRKVDKFLLYNLIQKVYQYRNTKMEAGEITILVNENDEINIANINRIAENVKRLNIITNNIKKFRKIVDYLYNELGILIKLSNNIKTNLKSTDIIVNIDFPEEMLNKLEIPNKAIIINLPNNINIITKKFSGINIRNWDIEIPDKYKMDCFNDKIIYESIIYKMPTIKIFNQIGNDNIKIKKIIGINGTINKKEFVKK